MYRRFCYFVINISLPFSTLQSPHFDDSSILGFDNYKAALSAHKIQQQLSVEHGPGPGLDPGPDPGSEIFANILRDFDDNSSQLTNESDDNSTREDNDNTFMALGAEILVNFDSEESVSGEGFGEDDNDNTSSDEGIARVRRPGERFTELDFNFLKEEWLETFDDSESSEEDYSDTD